MAEGVAQQDAARIVEEAIDLTSWLIVEKRVNDVRYDSAEILQELKQSLNHNSLARVINLDSTLVEVALYSFHRELSKIHADATDSF